MESARRQAGLILIPESRQTGADPRNRGVLGIGAEDARGREAHREQFSRLQTLQGKRSAMTMLPAVATSLPIDVLRSPEGLKVDGYVTLDMAEPRRIVLAGRRSHARTSCCCTGGSGRGGRGNNTAGEATGHHSGELLQWGTISIGEHEHYFGAPPGTAPPVYV